MSEKPNDPILRKLIDVQADRQMDGQMDKRDFIGCCSTNIKHPIKVSKNMSRHDFFHFCEREREHLSACLSI